MMQDYRSYFNSYAKISPSRLDYLKDQEAGFPNAHDPGEARLNAGIPYGQPDLFVELEKVKYARVYRIMGDECAFRNVPVPKLFLDVENTQHCAFSFSGLYAISLPQDEIDNPSDMELRWILAHELKHLYQDSLTTNSRQARQNELDSDRAAVESTDYQTAVSVMNGVLAERMHGYQRRQPVRALFYRVARALGFDSPEHCFLGGGKKYPSIGKRLKAMRKWEQENSSSDVVTPANE